MRNFITALLITLALSTTLSASGAMTCSTDYNGNTICVDSRR